MAAAAALAALPLGLVLLLAPSTQPDAEAELTFSDPDIVESSGLVMTSELAVTVNDSGDSARIFTVDRATGKTVGVTRWSGEATDVEALAPAGGSHVWVGDIGDNLARRDSVTVTKVPFGRGDQDVAGETYELVYPDGARDAESLATHPDTGRLFVVSKSVLGGSIFRAPKVLDPSGPNRLEEVADAPGLATDAAFTPDGSRLLVRNYGRLIVLANPGFAEVGSMRLPPQKQGEGIAVDPSGAVFLSSEGAKSDVLRLEVPREVMGDAQQEPANTATADPEASAEDSTESEPAESAADPAAEPAAEVEKRDIWPWLAGLGAALVAIWVLVRSLRPR